MIRTKLLQILSVAVLLAAMPVFSADAPPKKYKLLFLTQSGGFEHGSIHRKAQGVLSVAEIAVTEIGTSSGLFETRCTKDASIITPELLKDTDIIMFYTTGGIMGPTDKITPKTPENEWKKENEKLPITKENWDAFEAWLKAGHAFVGTHSATDTMANHTPYFKLINGSFAGHPWGSGTTVTITNSEPTHPVVKMFDPEFTWKDEIYQYKNYDPNAVRMLLSLNMEKCNPKMPYLVPISWVRDYDQGRVFYTNLGHNEGTWTNEKFRAHLLAGIRWALKLEDGPSTPNPQVQEEANRKSKEAGAAAGVQEVAAIAGKDPAELLKKFDAARKADATFAEKILPRVVAVHNIDAKKDGEKKKSEAAKVVEEIEKTAK